MEKFRNKYRIESNRLQGWNYANSGLYFITIVTANRMCVFGNVENGEMRFSELGKIAYNEFLKSFEIRKELQLGAFCLMPNHLHAIVGLENHITETNVENEPLQQCESQPHGIAYRSPKSISSFVAQYKSAVVSQYDDLVDATNVGEKYNRANPLWQSNYHDHIIRTQLEYNTIENYIYNNPLKWNDDKFFQL